MFIIYIINKILVKMWLTTSENSEKRNRNGNGNGNVKNQLVAVGVTKSKGSQQALKWAVDNVLQRGQIVVLVHVNKHPQHASHSSPGLGRQPDQQTKGLFLPFRCFCTRKDIQCWDVVIEDSDVAKALLEFVGQSAIEMLFLGAVSKGSFIRLSKGDTPAVVSRGAPDFCSVYVITKEGKVSSMRSATRPAPLATVSIRNQIMNHLKQQSSTPSPPVLANKGPKIISSPSPFSGNDDTEFRTPSITRGGRHQQVKSYGEMKHLTSDISFVGFDRGSMESLFPPFEAPAVSSSSTSYDYSYDRPRQPSFEVMPTSNFSNASEDDNATISWSNMQPQAMDDVEAEMRRLKMELKQTIDMYSNACKEALSAKQKASELQKWKADEERKSEDNGEEEESTEMIIERERAKSKAAMEAAEAHKRIAEIEAQRRMNAEMRALKEVKGRRKALSNADKNTISYRKYTVEEIEIATDHFSMERKIGEAGYGPVFRCYLDHTLTAVKVLRPDAAQGRIQFQQEVEVLSCIRHPNMVLLLGACPEYGCLVYEYMHNGSLEDRLFCHGGSPPLPWQHRFRIAAEIATGLLFLHQTKPEPIVHRDLKPANILLDRNLVSKISDVGLARLVPPKVAEGVTQCMLTSAAGTFCYIDPEYQQTGMLGVKSDVYSLGVLLLQVITAKPPMGLTHHVERAIEEGTFEKMLDKKVTDWPVDEAISFAKMSLGCAEMRRKDRPDLGRVVLPELARLRYMAEESLDAMMFVGYGYGYNGLYPQSKGHHSVTDLLSGPPSQDRC